MRIGTIFLYLLWTACWDNRLMINLFEVLLSWLRLLFVAFCYWFGALCFNFWWPGLLFCFFLWSDLLLIRILFYYRWSFFARFYTIIFEIWLIFGIKSIFLLRVTNLIKAIIFVWSARFCNFLIYDVKLFLLMNYFNKSFLLYRFWLSLRFLRLI